MDSNGGWGVATRANDVLVKWVRPLNFSLGVLWIKLDIHITVYQGYQ